ncbi:AraC family transcriptional regulator [Streptomyces sp. SBT349]|uniref:AraC family transcriptional regulator n=1 Tax=Streptomyces sp. SBT349 TaxID=1580539 RepID=UPI00066D72AA
MDMFTELLDGVRARGALFAQAVMDPPWALRFATGVPLTLVTMVRGEAWLVPPTGEGTAGGGTAGAGRPVRLGPGDVAILRGPAPFTVADTPATPQRRLVTGADYCDAPDGAGAPDGAAEEAEGEVFRLGPRTCGTSRDGSALLLSGAYERRGEVSERLLAMLPGTLVLGAGDGEHRALLELVAAEVDKARPGQQLVLDRLLDLLLIATLRGWLARPGTHAPAWYRALDDPSVGGALRLLHERPAHRWTVAALAAEAGVSRAAFARRFTELVGEPPMSYLAGWRTALAADLLRETDATVGSVAGRVGYANAFSLSVAFKRRYGTSPTEHRSGRTGGGGHRGRGRAVEEPGARAERALSPREMARPS